MQKTIAKYAQFYLETLWRLGYFSLIPSFCNYWGSFAHRRHTKPFQHTGEIAEQPKIQDCRVPRNSKHFLRERFLPPAWIWLMKCFLGTCSVAHSTSSSMLSTCTLIQWHHCLFNYILTNISCLFKCFFFDAESRLHHWPRDLSPLPLQQLPSREGNIATKARKMMRASMCHPGSQKGLLFPDCKQTSCTKFKPGIPTYTF